MDLLKFSDLTIKRLKMGPWASLAVIDTLIKKHSDDGYAIQTTKARLWLLSHFCEWLNDKGITELQDVTSPLIADFVGSRPPHQKGRIGIFVLPSLIGTIKRISGVSEPQPTRNSNLEPCIASFKRYLTEERGLADATVGGYVDSIHKFLSTRFGAEPAQPPALSDLNQADITGHLVYKARTIGSGGMQNVVCALRAFLRFLFLRGETPTNLAGSVLKVAYWRLQELPKALEPDQVQLLLKHCDRTTAEGRRDYAVLLLLARLGLRAGDVLGMNFESIDWDAGEIILYGKSKRLDRLPMPRDVGEAIVAYIRNGRPACATRAIFVRARPPHTELRSLSDIVQRGLKRAQLNPARKGAHLLRHGLATQMLRRGASLAEIGQVLRHQRVDTTAIYTKVDLSALQSLALPWPGGAK